MPAVPTSLRERDDELAALTSAAAVVASGRAATLLISGEAGIGKSALVGAAVELARGHAMTVLRARGVQVETGSPLGVVRQLLDPLLGRADAAQRDRWLAGAASRVAALLAEGAPTPPGPAAHHPLYWLLVNLADDGPLAVVVDDVHWADAESARFLAFLAARSADLPLLLVVGGRPTPVLDELALDPTAVTLRPRPLSERAVTDWLRDDLGVTPGAEVGPACLAATGGNPFLLRELVGEIRAEGIDVAAGPAPLLGLTPVAVTASVLLRLRPLSADATALARAVAVLEECDLATASPVAGLAPHRAGSSWDALVAADVLADATTLVFRHPLVRRAVHQDTTGRVRAELHGRAAEVRHDRGAPEPVVAAHLLAAPPGLPGWGTELLRRTASRAVQGGHHGVAVTHLRRVLAETPPGPAQSPVLRELGRATTDAGLPGGVEQLDAAVARAGTVADRVAATVTLAGVLRSASYGTRAVAALREAREGLDDVTDPGGALRLDVDLELLACTSTSRSARLALAGWRAERVHDAGGVPTGEWDALALASVALDGALDARPLPLVLDQLARTVAGAQRLGDSALRGQATAMASLGYLCVEQFDAADALVARLAAVATDGGYPAVLAVALAVRAGVELRRGELGRAAADAERALELGRETETSRVLLPRAGAVLVSVAAARGEKPPGWLADAEIDDDSVAARLLAHARAELLLARGEDTRAVAELLAYGARNVELGWAGVATPWRSQAGLALARLGEPDRAAELVAEELALARRGGTPRAVGVATWAAGLLAAGSARRTLLAEAVDLLSRTGCRLEHATALVDLGAEVAVASDIAAAREPLRQGHDLALRAGATVLAERARRELRRAGARPRRTELSGVESLTPAEARVAELVAAGRTNRHAAQELFVTEKTVETHLGRVFGKLGVRTRRELGPALRQSRDQ